MMESTSVARRAHASTRNIQSLEVASQLRAAVLEGDEARIVRLLSDLLRVTGLTRGQRVRLQLRTLLNLVHSLRSATLNDEVTGLYNRRGFTQIGTRLLDLSQRDERPAYLVYLQFDRADVVAPAAVEGEALYGDSLFRQVGNLMRDLFPGYGVYEVLGRLSTREFAALTPHAENASCRAVLRHAHQLEGGAAACGLRLRAGVAQFDPARPVAVDELLHDAVQAVNAPQPLSRIASSGLSPQPGVTLC